MAEIITGIREGQRDSFGPCFPVRDESVRRVVGEIRSIYSGNLGQFVEAEERHIAKDQNLKDFLDIAYGRFERIGDLDRAAYLDGASFVHRVLREQGEVPLIREQPSDALERETKFYEGIADKNNGTLGDTMLHAQDYALSRFPELTDTEFGRELKRMTDEHPIKPSFALGADMMFSVIKNADLQNLTASVALDDEIDSFFGDK